MFDSKKGAAIGFGQKQFLAEWVEKNAKTNPAPDQYFANESSLSKLSFAFGGETKFNQKRFISKFQSADRLGPGVGEYNIPRELRENVGKTIGERNY